MRFFLTEIGKGIDEVKHGHTFFLKYFGFTDHKLQKKPAKGFAIFEN